MPTLPWQCTLTASYHGTARFHAIPVYMSRTPSAFAVKNVVVLFAQMQVKDAPILHGQKIGKTRAAPQCKDRQPL